MSKQKPFFFKGLCVITSSCFHNSQFDIDLHVLCYSTNTIDQVYKGSLGQPRLGLRIGQASMIIKGFVKRGPRLAKSNSNIIMSTSNIEAMSMPWGNGLVNDCDLERHLVQSQSTKVWCRLITNTCNKIIIFDHCTQDPMEEHCIKTSLGQE